MNINDVTTCTHEQVLCITETSRYTFLRTGFKGDGELCQNSQATILYGVQCAEKIITIISVKSVTGF